jgi:hypothetical protein
MRLLRAVIFAYFPAFWLFPYLWDEKCAAAYGELFRYGVRRRNCCK